MHHILLQLTTIPKSQTMLVQTAQSFLILDHFLDLCDLENVNLPTAGDSNLFQPDAKPYCTEKLKRDGTLVQEGCQLHRTLDK